MLNLKKNIMIVAILMVCAAGVFVGGCGGWYKAGEGSALVSATLELFKSGKGGTETFIGDRGSLQAREASQKPSHEEKLIAIEQEENNTEIKKQLITAGLGEHVADALRQ